MWLNYQLVFPIPWQIHGTSIFTCTFAIKNNHPFLKCFLKPRPVSQIYCSRNEVAERGERWDWSRQLLDRDGESPGFGGRRFFLCFFSGGTQPWKVKHGWNPKNHGKLKSRKSSYKQTSMTLGCLAIIFSWGVIQIRRGLLTCKKPWIFARNFFPGVFFLVKSKA